MNQPHPDPATAELRRRARFGDQLRSTRKMLGLSLRKMGERVNLSAGYLAHLENGDVGVPPRSTILSICEGLGVKPTLLISAAGLVPDDQEQSQDVQLLASMIAELEPDQRDIVRAFVVFTREQNLTRR